MFERSRLLRKTWEINQFARIIPPRAARERKKFIISKLPLKWSERDDEEGKSYSWKVFLLFFIFSWIRLNRSWIQKTRFRWMDDIILFATWNQRVNDSPSAPSYVALSFFWLKFMRTAPVRVNVLSFTQQDWIIYVRSFSSLTPFVHLFIFHVPATSDRHLTAWNK